MPPRRDDPLRACLEGLRADLARLTGALEAHTVVLQRLVEALPAARPASGPPPVAAPPRAAPAPSVPEPDQCPTCRAYLDETAGGACSWCGTPLASG